MIKGKNEQFVICIRSDSYPVSLQKGKIYFVIPDKKAEELELIRVIDESGEDYLYNKEYFEFVKLSPKLKTLIEKAYSLT